MDPIEQPQNELPVESSDSAIASAEPEPADVETPSFGWNRYAERINGRFAMIGFVALLIQELVTRKDFFTWLGL
jgi:hypothetical protein